MKVSITHKEGHEPNKAKLVLFWYAKLIDFIGFGQDEIVHVGMNVAIDEPAVTFIQKKDDGSYIMYDYMNEDDTWVAQPLKDYLAEHFINNTIEKLVVVETF